MLVLGLMGVRALPVYLILACLALVVGGFSLYQIKNNFAALRWWGALALAAVILQGVLGGLRVVWLKDQIGIFHAALAQLFFALTCLIACAGASTIMPIHSGPAALSGMPGWCWRRWGVKVRVRCGRSPFAL